MSDSRDRFDDMIDKMNAFEKEVEQQRRAILGDDKVEGGFLAARGVLNPDNEPVEPAEVIIRRLRDSADISIPVLAIHHEQLGTMYLDTLKGIEEQLEVFWGEDNEWRDYIGDKLTITVKVMKKSDFDALEPFEP